MTTSNTTSTTSTSAAAPTGVRHDLAADAAAPRRAHAPRRRAARLIRACALVAATVAAATTALCATPAQASSGQDRLRVGEALTTNQWIAAGDNRLVMQSDGNLVLYAAQNIPLWSSNTSGNAGAYLALQGDGNAVIIAAGGRPVWASGTNNRGADRFMIQSDGNLVVYTGNGVGLWSSNTYRQAFAANRFRANGWGAEQWSCLNQLWNRESRWNELARNASSGAYGIPQSLPASKMKAAGNDYLTNPYTQIVWGEDLYIKPRYGTPCAAWSHETGSGWY